MRFRTSITRAVALGALALLTAGTLAGCTASGASSAGSDAGGTSSGSIAEKGAPASGGSSAASASGSALSAKQADRSVTVTGDVALTAKDPIGTADRVDAVVTGAGGHVDALDQQPTGHATAVLTVRIPAAVFPATLKSIEQEGHVRTVTLHSTDVTAQVTDYGVRIAALRTSITRLQALLARATTTSDLVEIESTLTARQTSLEQLLAQQKTLDDQVAFATLGVSITEPTAVRTAPPTNFGTGFVAGFAALVASLSALVVVIGVLLPWVVTLGVLGLVGWWVARAVRRRARGRTPVAP